MTKSTGVGPGGRREGAGRPRGSKTKHHRAALFAKAAAEGLELPLERILRRMNDTTLPKDYRDQLAGMAAPYLHPRLSAVSVQTSALYDPQETMLLTPRRPHPSQNPAVCLGLTDVLRRRVPARDTANIASMSAIYRAAICGMRVN